MSDILKDANPKPLVVWSEEDAYGTTLSVCHVKDPKHPYDDDAEHSCVAEVRGKTPEVALARANLIVAAVNSFEANQAALAKARELAERVTRSWDNSNAELKAIGMRPNPDSHAPLYLKTARELLKLLPKEGA